MTVDKLKELTNTTEMLQTKLKFHLKAGKELEEELREHYKELLKWLASRNS